MIKQEDVTIIIPHLGGSEESEYALDQCLMSLSDWTSKILLVNNGTLPCKHLEHAGIIVNEQGQCKAVNAAVATVSTPWILVTNDDMVYSPGWFEALTQDMVLAVPSVGGATKPVLCVSPQLVEPRNGAPTFINYFCGGAGGDFDKQKFLDFVKNHISADIGLRPGFNLPFLISKELWDTVGGYDVNYDPWGSNSDSDLEYKIMLAGVQPFQQTNCLVYHFSQTSGTFEPRNQSYWQKNWDYFIEKWGFPRTDNGIWEATFEIPDGKFRPSWEGKYK